MHAYSSFSNSSIDEFLCLDYGFGDNDAALSNDLEVTGRYYYCYCCIEGGG